MFNHNPVLELINRWILFCKI